MLAAGWGVSGTWTRIFAANYLESEGNTRSNASNLESIEIIRR